MSFAIPGLQDPIDPKKNNVRVKSDDFGNIQFKIDGPLAISAPFPDFEVIIVNASATVVYEEVFRSVNSSTIIQLPNPNRSGLVDYYFKTSIKDGVVLNMGNYRVRVYKDKLLINELWLTVQDSGRQGELDEADVKYEALAAIAQGAGANIDYGFKRLGSSVLIGIDTVALGAELTIHSHPGHMSSQLGDIIGVTTSSILRVERSLLSSVDLQVDATAYLGRVRGIDTDTEITVDGSAFIIRERLLGADVEFGVDAVADAPARVRGIGSDIEIGVVLASGHIHSPPLTGSGDVNEVFLTSMPLTIGITIDDAAFAKQTAVWLDSTDNVVGVATNADILPHNAKHMQSHVTQIFVLTYTPTITAFRPPPTQFTSNIDIFVDTSSELLDTHVCLGANSGDPVGGGYADIMVDASADIIREQLLASDIDLFIETESLLTRNLQLFSAVDIFVDVTGDLSVHQAMASDLDILVDSDALLSVISYLFPTASIDTTLDIVATPDVLETVVHIAVGDTPTAVFYNPNTEEFVTTNAFDDNISQIDIATKINLSPSGQYPVGTFPRELAHAPDKAKFAVCNADSNDVSIISDAYATLATVAVGDRPEYIAYADNEDKWAVVCVGDNKVYFIDSTTHAILNPGGTAIGANPGEVAYCPGTKRFMVVNTGDDTVSVLDATTHAVLTTLPVGDFPDSIKYFSGIDKFVVTNRNDGNVSIIDCTGATVSATVTTGISPSDSAYSPSLNLIAVCNFGGQNVSLIDGTTLLKVADVPANFSPEGIIWIEHIKKFLTRNELDDCLSVIDPITEALVLCFPVQERPYDFAFSPASTMLGIVNRNSDSISLVDTRYLEEV